MSNFTGSMLFIKDIIKLDLRAISRRIRWIKASENRTHCQISTIVKNDGDVATVTKQLQQDGKRCQHFNMKGPCLNKKYKRCVCVCVCVCFIVFFVCLFVVCFVYVFLFFICLRYPAKLLFLCFPP
jgi:hypothetical protein